MDASSAPMDLSGKVIVVTGEHAGPGGGHRPPVRRPGRGRGGCGGAGCRRGEQVASSLAEAGTEAIFVPAELSDPDVGESVLSAVDARFGVVHGLVNAAAETTRAGVWDTTSEVVDRLMAVNVRAPMLLLQAAARIMKRERVAGSIVNIGSVTGYGGQVYLLPYATSKGALHTLTRNAAYSLLWDRIRVNLVNLGWMDTPAEDVVQRETHGAGRGLADGGRGSPALRSADQAGRGGPHDLLPAVGGVRPHDGRHARLRPVRVGRRRLAQAPAGRGVAMTVRIGLLGCGRIGRMHAEMIARRIPGLALTRVFDVRRAAAEETAAALGGVVDDTPEDLIGADDVDAIAICSSTDTHVELLVAGAAAGKPIFCEKPLTLDLPDLDRGLAAVEAAKVLLQVGFNRRYDPSHREVRDRVAGGRRRRAAPGADHQPRPGPAPHRLHRGLRRDLLRHDDPRLRHGPIRHRHARSTEVYATGAVRVDPAIGDAGDLDTAVVVLQPRRRRDHHHRQQPPGRLRLRPAGRGLRLRWDGRVRERPDHHDHPPQRHRGPAVRRSRTSSGSGTRPATWPSGRRSRSIVESGGPSPVTGEDGRAALVAGLAAWRSVREGRPVAVDALTRTT